MTKKQASSFRQKKPQAFSAFERLNGQHPLQSVVPSSVVNYPVRTRHGGSVFIFNFGLAKEMGLIPQNAPEVMTSALQQKILETFSLVIINEYDQEKKIEYPKKDIRPHRYMATRYLQLQHPNKKGATSGDGRGIWNGQITHQGTTWDVMSSGTGATCLSPACAIEKKFFKTGDKQVGYGNGYNYLTDGLSAYLMSHIFHEQGIQTERILTIIHFEDGSAIHVRASESLLRPAHFFRLIKLNQIEELKRLSDYHIQHQTRNGKYHFAKSENKYEAWIKKIAIDFARSAAKFEVDYIFCWMEWDGDNILMNGGIIDYGSIRQFGLFHKEYRYDDVDRFSTNLIEQKLKARLIVQTFCQIRNALKSGKKESLETYQDDPVLSLFDQEFEREKARLKLQKIGLSLTQAQHLEKNFPNVTRKFVESHTFFEYIQSKKGIIKTSDGVTSNAVFSMRDFNREVLSITSGLQEDLSYEDFQKRFKSLYARPLDLEATPKRVHHLNQLLDSLKKIFKVLNLSASDPKVLMEAQLRNTQHRVTGDGILHLTSSFLRNRKKMTYTERSQALHALIMLQVRPDLDLDLDLELSSQVKEFIDRNTKALIDYRQGL